MPEYFDAAYIVGCKINTAISSNKPKYTFLLVTSVYSKSYGLSVYPITFDLVWHWKVKSRSLGINLAVYHRQLDIISVA